MARCWSCGSQLSGGARHLITCPACSQVEELKELRKATPNSLGDLARVQELGFQRLSESLTEIASVIEWGFSEISWQLHEQTTVLRDIAHTLKTPTETQAEELRQMAEELRRRSVYEESKKRFLKALDLNPLDYRTYIGLTHTYLQMGDFDEAKVVLEKSLPHAPREEVAEGMTPRIMTFGKVWEYGVFSDGTRPPIPSSDDNPTVSFDYKGYSYRLIGRICYCQEDYSGAVEALRNSIELSPDYYDGHYDYAQYCALVGDKKQCIPSLAMAVKGRPLYFYLAEKEKNFEPLRPDVKRYLDEWKQSVSEFTRQVISQSGQFLSRFGRTLSKAEEAARQAGKYLKKADFFYRVKYELDEARSLHESTMERLSRSRDMLKSGDYEKTFQVGIVWCHFPHFVRETIRWVEDLHRLCQGIRRPWYDALYIDIFQGSDGWKAFTYMDREHCPEDRRDWRIWLEP